MTQWGQSYCHWGGAGPDERHCLTFVPTGKQEGLEAEMLEMTQHVKCLGQ